MSADSEAALQTLQAYILELEITVKDLKEELEEAREELQPSKDEIDKLQARIDELEEASDPDEICEYVHEFLRVAHVLPDALDAPLKLAPHDYRMGLYNAVQEVCE